MLPISDLFFQLLTPGLIAMGFILFWFAFSKWSRNAKERAEDDYRERALQREIRDRELKIEQDKAFQDEARKSRQYEIQEKLAREAAAGTGSGGFIFLDLPEDKRSLFHDLLKGFEEYAQLKGYKVYFSIDATYGEKIAFKFTPAADVINVSPEKVKADFREYIEKIDSGEPLSNLPMVLPKKDHDLLLMKMINRLNFVQHSYNLEKNAHAFYENLLKEFSASRILPAPSIVFNNTGGDMSSKSYNAVNSQRLIQGENNTLTDNSVDSSIRIAESFNEQGIQIQAVAELIKLLKEDTDNDGPYKEKAIINLEKVKDEMSTEGQPDKSRIQKWLGTAKSGLEVLKLGKPVVEKAIEVFKSFDWPDLPSFNIPG